MLFSRQMQHAIKEINVCFYPNLITEKKNQDPRFEVSSKAKQNKTTENTNETLKKKGHISGTEVLRHEGEQRCQKYDCKCSKYRDRMLRAETKSGLVVWSCNTQLGRQNQENHKFKFCLGYKRN